MQTQQTKDLSTHKVYSDGTELPGTLQIISIVVEQTINRVPVARIIFKDGDPSKQNFEVSNNAFFEPGKTIKIEAGFHSQNKLIFEGMIIKQHLKLKGAKDSLLVVECKDKAYRMTLARKSKYFLNVKDSDAVETILGGYELKKGVDPTPITHKQLVQYNATDWDFMISRMEMNGFVVWIDNGTVNCKKPVVESSGAVTTTFGTDVLAFDAQLDATHQYESVTCEAWDISAQDIATSQNESVGIAEAGNLTSTTLAGKVNEKAIRFMHSGKLPVEELKHWATALQKKNVLSKARGTITCKGNFDAKPMSTLTMSGFGDHLNGNHFISGVRHELRNNLWETSIQFGWSQEIFADQFQLHHAPAAGILPSVHGLQVGVVTQIEDDKENEFRVQVKFPLMDNKADGIRARIALLDAGNGRGSYFMPEVHDEVIVGFINNDPRDAVILGMLNSSKNPAPFTPTKDNFEKGFVTKNKLKVIFNDDEKSILIQTPKGNEIKFTEKEKKVTLKDQHKNMIEMTKEGIKIESCKDIILKAKKDIKAEGVNIEMKGSGNFKAEGSGGAKLSSSGSTDLKGSIVNIN
ncbi:type VI secretion system tip protein VgrG [Pseudochryseolinea flava]|uniref:Rhs element Vgr protein n=1 Tax=Pseudochryseolinea flava TaxID=2059302 RepID=A0A364Y3U2_9BACT|nr:type VI secretion system tip protein VgrG [Pseudochryseolinea flava]RAW01592.1 Rhs element Vgr protein [Pseudochryseolinea flava]